VLQEKFSRGNAGMVVGLVVEHGNELARRKFMTATGDFER
jgi:hypothetical protein